MHKNPPTTAAAIGAANKNLSNAEAQAALLSFTKDAANLPLTVQVVGVATPVTSSAFPQAHTLISAQPVLTAGAITQVSFFASDAATCKIKRLRKNADGQFYTAAEFSVTSAVGTNTFTAAQINGGVTFPVDAGDYLAFYGATVRLHYTTNQNGWVYWEYSGEIGQTPQAAELRGTLLRRLEISYQVSTQAAADDLVIVGANTAATASALSTVSLVTNALAQPFGVLKALTLNVHTLGNGTFRLARCKFRMPDNPEFRAEVLDSVLLTATGTGNNRFVAGTDFTFPVLGDKEFFAIQTISGGAQPRYTTASGAGYLSYVGTASSAWVYAGEAGEIYMQLEIARMAPAASNADVVLEQWDYLTAAPALAVGPWSAPTWTYSAGAAVSGTIGLANALKSNLYASGNERGMRWEFAITNATSIVSIFTDPGQQGIAAGSMVDLTSSTGESSVMSAYNGANTPSALVTESLGFALSTGRRYVAELVIRGRSLTIKVWDKSGSGYYEKTRAASPLGYAGPGATNSGYDQGAGQGYAGLAFKAGAGIVYSFRHWAECPQGPQLLVVGDSITQGFAVTDAQRYAQLVRDALDDDSAVAVCAFGGSGIGQYWWNGELAAIRPRNTLVCLGTNGSPTAAQYRQVQVSVALIGGSVLFATIPTSATATGFINALPASVGKVAFDLALTATGAGTTPIAGYYAGVASDASAFNDGVHPNSSGNTQMFRRILLNAPLLVPTP